MADDLVALLRQRIQAAGESYSGPNRERFAEFVASVRELDGALDALDAACMDGDGNTLTNPATQAVAQALLGVDTTVLHGVAWGACPDWMADHARKALADRVVAVMAGFGLPAGDRNLGGGP